METIRKKSFSSTTNPAAQRQDNEEQLFSKNLTQKLSKVIDLGRNNLVTEGTQGNKS